MLKELAESILQTLNEVCKNIYGRDLISIAVYGSVARNTQTFGSDIDLLFIVKNLPNGRMNRMNDFVQIENRLAHELQHAREHGWNVDLSPFIRTPDEVNIGGYLYLDMVDDAVILYDKNNFFADYLKHLKKRLEEYGAKKRPWKGGYYWEIKPDLKAGEVIKL